MVTKVKLYSKYTMKVSKDTLVPLVVHFNISISGKIMAIII